MTRDLALPQADTERVVNVVGTEQVGAEIETEETASRGRDAGCRICSTCGCFDHPRRRPNVIFQARGCYIHFYCINCVAMQRIYGVLENRVYRCLEFKGHGICICLYEQ